MKHAYEPSPHLQPEIQAYQHALSVWETFHAQTKRPVLDDESRNCGVDAENFLEQILRVLPPVERTPTAIGLFVRAAGNWSPERINRFLKEFLPSPSPIVSKLLNSAVQGVALPSPMLPVTLEEFPSRIWRRAIASRSPERLASAAHLAFNAMIRLIELHKDDGDLEKPMTFWFPSVDLPRLIDLVALPQADHFYFKGRVLSHMYGKSLDGHFEPTFKDLASIQAWILANTAEGPPLLEKLIAETVATVEPHGENGQLCQPCRTRRLGCLMFRFGRRRLSYQCAKALGDSPWEKGWQFQVVSGDVHSRIRQIILGPKSDPAAWLEEPELACSSMSIPLWLVDGIARVEELIVLFNRAEECPWIFPRLQRIYQWHLAIAGKRESLSEIEQSNPNLAIGLAKGAAEAWLDRK